MVLYVNLNFKQHVFNVTKNISKFFNRIYRERRNLDRPLGEQLYFRLIYHNLIYCITAQGASNKNDTNPFQITQTKQVRADCDAVQRDSGRLLFLSLKIFNGLAVYNYMICIYIYKPIQRKEKKIVRYEFQQKTKQTKPSSLCFAYWLN